MHVYLVAPAGFVQGENRLQTSISKQILFLGVWRPFLSLIEKYRRHYKQLIMYSGPIFDSDYDGRADDVERIDSA